MADLILNTGDDVSLGASTTVVDVFGTNGAETLTFALGAEAVLDASFNRGLATLDFAGPAADYTASLSGSSLVLTDIDGGSVTIPVGTAGATLNFADGSRELVYNTTTSQIDLGSQVITSTPVAVTPGTTPPPAPTYEITPSTTSVGEGSSVTFTLATTDVPAGTTLSYTLAGTNDAAVLDGSGTFVTDSSGHASVTVSVPTNSTTGDGGTLTLSLLNGHASDTVTTVDTTVAPANPTYAVTPSTTSVGEGHSVTFTLATTGVPAGTTLSYTLAGTNDAAPLDGSGTFVTDSSGHASVTVNVPTNANTGDSGTLTLSLANGHASTTVNTVDTTTPPTPQTQTFTLTTGIDSFFSATGSESNVFNATDSNATGSPTLTNLDNLEGNGLAANAGGDTLNVGYTNNPINTTLIPGLTVAGIATAQLATTVTGSPSGYAILADTNTWTGLQDLVVSSGSTTHGFGDGIEVSAANTTNVYAVSSGGDVHLTGGQDISVMTVDAGVTIGNSHDVVTPGDSVSNNGAIAVVDTQVGHNDVDITGGNTAGATTTGVSVTTTGGTGGNEINIDPPTGPVTVSATQVYGDQGHTDVTGGTVDQITEIAANTTGTVSLGDVTVDGTNGTDGTAATTSVTITQTPEQDETSTTPGVNDGNVSIVDGNWAAGTTLGTITNVALSGIDGIFNNIEDTNLQALSIANAAFGSVITINDDPSSHLVSTPNLDLKVDNDQNLSVIEISGFGNPGYTSMTIDTTGTQGASSIGLLFTPDVVNLTLTGNQDLSMLGVFPIGIAPDAQINATGLTGSLLIEAPLGNDQGFTGGPSSGDETIGIVSTTQAIQMGGGDDTVYMYSGHFGTGGSLDGGAGYNTLVMSAANADTLSANLAPVTYFQQLDISETVGNNPVVINLQNLGGINYVQSEGTTATHGSGAPNQQVEDWTAPALLAGQSITIDGVTVTAYANTQAAAVADAVVAQLQNPGSNEDVPGYLTVSLNTGFLSNYDPNWAVTHGSSADQVVFSYTGGDGPQANVVPSFGAVEASKGESAPGYTLPAETAGTITHNATETIEFGANYTFTAGSSITIDGDTIENAGASSVTVTGQQLVAAFLHGTAEAGLTFAGPVLNTSEWTGAAGTDGTSIVLTAVNNPAPTFTWTNGSPAAGDPNSSGDTNGGAPSITPSATAAVAANGALQTVDLSHTTYYAGDSITVDGITVVVAAESVTRAALVQELDALNFSSNYGTATNPTIVTTTSHGVTTDQFAVYGTGTDSDWGPVSSNSTSVTYQYSNDAVANPTLVVSSSIFTSNVATPTNTPATLVSGTGIGTAPLTLVDFTSGGTLELTEGANVDANIYAQVVSLYELPTTFNIVLDGYVNDSGNNAPVELQSPGSAPGTGDDVQVLNVYSGGDTTSTNYLNITDSALTTLNISGTDSLYISDSPTSHGLLTTIDASASSGAIINVQGMDALLSATADISYTGGGGHLVADSAIASGPGIPVGMETITSGAGGVTFNADSLALGGSELTQSYAFNLDASQGARDTLNFVDGSAIEGAPATVSGFVAGDQYGHNYTTDVLEFNNGGGDTILAANAHASGVLSYTSGATGLEDTVANGIITFSGTQYVADLANGQTGLNALITAAETIVNNINGGAGGAGQVAAFVYNGDTYVVHSGATTQTASTDVVIDLQATTLVGLTYLGDNSSAHANYAMIG